MMVGRGLRYDLKKKKKKKEKKKEKKEKKVRGGDEDYELVVV